MWRTGHGTNLAQFTHLVWSGFLGRERADAVKREGGSRVLEPICNEKCGFFYLETLWQGKFICFLVSVTLHPSPKTYLRSKHSVKLEILQREDMDTIFEFWQTLEVDWGMIWIFPEIWFRPLESFIFMGFDTKRIRSESIFSKKLWTVKDTLVSGFSKVFHIVFSANGELILGFPLAFRTKMWQFMGKRWQIISW